MTAPLVGITNPYTVPAGGQPVRITDGTNNAPAGLTLINKGDNNGTVWLSPAAGPSPAAIPLGPGASMVWADRSVTPYAYLAAGSTKAETLVVTSQSTGYTNPVTVAAALAAQGVPSVYQAAVVYNADLPAGGFIPSIDVSGYASILISVQWKPTSSGTYVAGALQLQWTVAPGAQTSGQWLGQDALIDAGITTWQIPVTLPSFSVYNYAAGLGMPCRLVIIGTNRSVPRVRMVNDDALAGAKYLTTNGTATGPGQFMQLYAHDGAGNATAGTFSGGSCTRIAGPVKLHWNTATTGAGYIMCKYTDGVGTVPTLRFPISGTDGVIDWDHPALPVEWYYYTPGAGASMNLAVLAGSN